MQVSTNNSVLGTAVASAPAYPVLTSFQLEQLGENLKFVDRDGSIYSGLVITNAQPLEQTDAVTAQAQTPAQRPV